MRERDTRIEIERQRVICVFCPLLCRGVCMRERYTHRDREIQSEVGLVPALC